MADALPNLGNPADSDKLRYKEIYPHQSERQKHSPEKGWGYNRDRRKEAVTAAKRSWRKQINTIHSQLATLKNVSTLTAGCEDLENKTVQFSEAHRCHIAQLCAINLPSTVSGLWDAKSLSHSQLTSLTHL